MNTTETAHNNPLAEMLSYFADATNWKSYLRAFLSKYIRGAVLEVGAGIGATTKLLYDGSQRSWVCLEPDPNLARKHREEMAQFPHTCKPEIVLGDIRTVDTRQRFDCILYIDVLEHIEDDHQEMQRAANLLNPGGAIVVLCPAHQFLYCEFDRAVGHFRRYNRPLYRALKPSGVGLETVRYLDSVGMFLSMANRFALNSLPKKRHVLFWDRFVVPLSRLADPILAYRLGKSILGVWKKNSNDR